MKRAGLYLARAPATMVQERAHRAGCEADPLQGPHPNAQPLRDGEFRETAIVQTSDTPMTMTGNRTR